MSEGPIAFPRHIPFVQTLGFELWAFGGGKAEIRVPLSDGLLNSMSVAHGGLVMTLLDVAMAHAARSQDMVAGAADKTAADATIVTVEMKTSFMRPAQGLLRGVGELLYRSATLAFTEGRVFDGAGKLCAHATGTFKVVHPQGRLVRPAHPSPSRPTAPKDTTP